MVKFLGNCLLLKADIVWFYNVAMFEFDIYIYAVFTCVRYASHVPLQGNWADCVNWSGTSVVVCWYWVNEQCHRWFRWWLVACSAPSNYLSQWAPLVYFHFGLSEQISKKFKQYTLTFIQGNAFEYICQMATMLSWSRCVNSFHLPIRSLKSFHELLFT